MTDKLPSYGGQAVIEGVMMRGQKFMTLAVRNPKNEIVLHVEPLNPRIYSSFINCGIFCFRMANRTDRSGSLCHPN